MHPHILHFLVAFGPCLTSASIVTLDKRTNEDDVSNDLENFNPRRLVAKTLEDAPRIVMETNTIIERYVNTQDTIDAIFLAKVVDVNQYIHDRDDLHVRETWYKGMKNEVTYEWYKIQPQFKKDVDHPNFRAELRVAELKLHKIVDETVDRLEGFLKLPHSTFFPQEYFEMEALNRGPRRYISDKDEEPLEYLSHIDKWWDGNITRGKNYYEVIVERTQKFTQHLDFHQKAIPFNRWQVLKAEDQLWLWRSRKTAYETLFGKGNRLQRKKHIMDLWKKKQYYIYQELKRARVPSSSRSNVA